MLTGTSTRAEAVAQYRANLLYEEDATGAKARALIEACRFLLGDTSRSKHPNAIETERDLVRLEKVLKTAEQWLQALPKYSATGQAAGGQLPRQFSFERIRR